MERKTAKKVTVFTLALLLPCSVLAEGGKAAAEGSTADRTGDVRARMQQQNVLVPVSEETVQELRSVVGESIEAALNGDLEEFVENLVDADEDRLEDQIDDQDLALRTELENFRIGWREAYRDNRLIDWSDGNEVARVLDFPISRVNGETVHMKLTADQTMPGGIVEFVEGGIFNTSHRINAPDNLTAVQLRNKLSEALRTINASRSSWPTDRSKAAQAVAQRILSSVAIPASQSSVFN